MFGLMRTSTHDTAIAAKDVEIARLNEALTRETERANRIAGKWSLTTRGEAKARLELSDARRELAAANAELAEFRAKKAKRIANLRNHKPAAVPATN